MHIITIMNYDKSDIAKTLKAMRLSYNINQTNFAKYVSTTQGTVSKVENLEVSLGFDLWVRIADFYKIDGHKEIIKGHYDGLRSLNSKGFEKSNLIKKKIRNNYCLTIRELLPLKHFFESQNLIDNKNYRSSIYSSDLIFRVFDERVNLSVLYEGLTVLKEENLIKKFFKFLEKNFLSVKSHGKLFENLSLSKSKAIENYLSSQKHYQCYYNVNKAFVSSGQQYTLELDDKFMTPELKENSHFQKFLGDYFYYRLKSLDNRVERVSERSFIVP